MNKTVFPFLPKTPIDRFEIKYWVLSKRTYNHSIITSCKARYYVNTPYEKLFPEDDRKGVPLIDEWMIYEIQPDGKEYATGRVEGWEFHFYDGHIDSIVFLSFREALQEYKAFLEKRKKRILEELKETTQEYAEVVNRIEQETIKNSEEQNG